MGVPGAGKSLEAEESKLVFEMKQTCPTALDRESASLHLHKLCDFAFCRHRFQILWRAGGGGEDCAKCSKTPDIIYSG